MQGINLGKSIVRVSVAKPDGSGLSVIHKGRKPKKKKQSKELRPLEKAVRHIADANLAFAQTFSDNHKKSNKKKKDGWAKDLSTNLLRAQLKAQKKL